MSKQGLEDTRAYLYVFGCILQQPSLVDSLDYPLNRIDFNTEEFYESLFVAIYNLYVQGAETISEFDVDTAFASRPEKNKIFVENKGLEYLVSARDMADLSNYEYYYHKIKKYSLLRYYEDKGLDTSFIYNPNITDIKLREKEQQKFEELTEDGIIGQIEEAFVLTPKSSYTINTLTDECQAGSGLTELIQKYLDKPKYGYPFCSIAFTTLVRGAREGTLYLRSGLTGTGKTRQAMMDACYISVPYMYNLDKQRFVHTGRNIPVLFIGTEGSCGEFQEMALSVVSGVPTDHIQDGIYEPGEYERVLKADKYIKEAPLYIVYCDDYSIADIENIVKKYVITKQIEVCFFDYLQSSLRLMDEIKKKGASGMQEYQILRVFATRLKALAEREKICIISSTQLNDTVNEKKYKDQSCLEGSKSIANKIDAGIVWTTPNAAEKAKIEQITHNQVGCPKINLLQWAYKVRNGKYSRIIICSHLDLGHLRIKDCFITDYDFHLIDMPLDKVEVVDEKIIDTIVSENSINMNEAPEPGEETSRKFDW